MIRKDINITEYFLEELLPIPILIIPLTSTKQVKIIAIIGINFIYLSFSKFLLLRESKMDRACATILPASEAFAGTIIVLLFLAMF